MRRLVMLLLLAAAFLAGMAVGLPPATGEGGTRAVATVGSDAVTTDDMVAFLYVRYRDAWVRTMEALLDERIVEYEVRRLGVRLPAGALDKAVDKEVAARREQLADTYGEGVKLEDEVRRGYGVDLETWKREVLRPRVNMQLLLTRIVRLDTRRRERVLARVIVFQDEARAVKIRERLQAGADFSLTALKESVDPTAQSGGTLPAIARGDLTIPNVEDRLFEAKPGALVGPIPVTLGGTTLYHLYKVIEHVAPWSGTRAEILARLETDLAEHRIERAEFERWRSRMRRDFRTRVFDPEGRPVVLPSLGGG